MRVELNVTQTHAALKNGDGRGSNGSLAEVTFLKLRSPLMPLHHLAILFRQQLATLCGHGRLWQWTCLFLSQNR